MDIRLIWKEHAFEAQKVIEFFSAPSTDPELHEHIKSVCGPYVAQPDSERLVGRLGAGRFTISDLTKWRQAGNPNFRETAGLKEVVIDRMCRLGLLSHLNLGTWAEGYGIVSDHGRSLLASLCNQKALENAVFGWQYIFQKYSPCIYKVLVTNSEGDPSIGTAFAVQHQGIHLAVSNLHVIGDCESYEVKDIEGRTFDVIQELDVCEDDLKILVLAEDPPSSCLPLGSGVSALDEVMVCGFPAVPFTDSAIQVCHLGEVNALANTLDRRRRVIYSARTEPGNSGGPVLDLYGRVVGVATNQFFSESGFEKGNLPYYACIPSELLESAISSVQVR